MLLNPSKIPKYQTDLEKARKEIRSEKSINFVSNNLSSFYRKNLCRETYEKMDLQKSYPALFELLWYSQLPCYDIMNITTVEGQENGNV